MKKALVLAGGIPQIRLIEELQSRGYYVILADYGKMPVARPYADKFFCKSTLDIEAMRNIAITEQVDLITTCCTDQALAVVSLLSQELGIPCYVDANIGKAVTNKRYMKKRFVEWGIPTADYCIVSEEKSEIQMKYPLIVKPVDSNSSKGVTKARSEAELYSAVQIAREESRTNAAIVEEFIEGFEVSVDAFVVNRIADVLCLSLTEKIRSVDKFIINRGIYPAPLTIEQENKIRSVVQKIADAFSMDNGPMLVQLLIKGEDIYVIEFSARTGGCIKYNMIQLATGVDVIKAMLDITEGKQISLEYTKSEKVIINEFLYVHEGVFSHLEGVEECKNRGWVQEVFALKSKGTVVGNVASSGDRVAALTYVADSMEIYRTMRKKALEHLKVMDVNGKNLIRYDLLGDE